MSIASGTDSAYQQALLNINTQNLDPSVVANTPQNIGALYNINPSAYGFRTEIVGDPGDTSTVYRKAVAPNVDAVYDESGKLQGYQGQNAYTTDQSFVHGQWDTSGKANPISTTKSSGGMLGSVGNTLLGLSLGYFGGSAIADALGGGGALSGGANIGLANDLGMASDYASAANAGAFGAPTTVGAVPNIGTLPTFGPGVQVADASGALPTSLSQIGNPSAASLAADNIDVGGGFNPATGAGDAATAAAAAQTGVTPSAFIPYGATSGLGQTVNFGNTGVVAPTMAGAAGVAGGAAAGAAGSSSLKDLLTPTNVLGATALGSLFTGLNTSDAIKNAMGTQQGAYTQSVGTLGDIANYIRGIQAPYQQAGVEALNLLGQNKDYLTHQFNAQDLASGLAPNYDFMLQQGQMANQRAANLAGGALGGNALQGLNQFTQNYAGNAYQNAFQNYQAQRQNIYNTLAGIAGLGQTSTGQLTGAAGTYGTNLTNLNVGNAAAQAAGQIAQAGNVGSTISNIGNTALLASLLNQKGTVTP